MSQSGKIYQDANLERKSIAFSTIKKNIAPRKLTFLTILMGQANNWCNHAIQQSEMN